MTNNKEILFQKAHFVPLIWGSESWVISGYKGASSIVCSGSFSGTELRSLWENHRELFGNAEGAEFPHLIKFIDAQKDLSVQVHPNDNYAQKVEHEDFGKQECWYILDCKPGATIIIGHKCSDKEQMKDCINSGKWDEVLNEIPIQPGDFFPIEPGTIHAIKAGTKILETQQNSDLTYRLYDYDRLENGSPRELHIDKALDVINFNNPDVKKSNFSKSESLKTLIYRCSKFSVYLYNIKGEGLIDLDAPFINCSVIEGEGEIDGHKIHAEDSFILPCGYGPAKLNGSLKLIVSHL